MKRKLLILALALLLVLSLCACGETAPVTTPEPAQVTPSPTPTMDIGRGLSVPVDTAELSLHEGEYDYQMLLDALPALTGLKHLTLPETALTGAQLDALRGAGSGLSIDYTLNLAGQVVGPEASELDLSALTAEDFPAALEQMKLLPGLTTVTLARADQTVLLGTEQIQALRETFPGIEVYYELPIGDKLYGPGAEALDLGRVDPAELPEVLEKLPLLPDLQTIEMMDAANETRYTQEQVKAVMDAAPNARVHYEFDLFGKHISTLDERVEYDSVEVHDSDEAAIRAALDILPYCTYFKLDLDRPGMENEIFASIRDDYADRTQVVWRVFVSSLNMLTDEEILRITHIVTDKNCEPLKYCTGAVYVDLGHNENGQLTDTSYLGYMTNLECLIMSGAAITDLSPLANCKKLTWLELGYCGTITDLSPLAEIPDLKYLNISGEYQITDLSALDNVKLERFMASECRIPFEEQQRFKEQHPDCLVGFSGFLYGYPWRYNEGVAALFNAFDYYKTMRILFCYYDGDDYWGNHKNSAYGDGYIESRLAFGQGRE